MVLNFSGITLHFTDKHVSGAHLYKRTSFGGRIALFVQFLSYRVAYDLL